MTDNTSTLSTFNQPLYWAKWVLATAGGWFIGSMANVLVINLLGATGLGDALNATSPDQIPQSTALLLAGVSLALLLIVGFAVGALQWLVLRQQIPQIGRWAIFTGLGFALGTFAFLAFMGLGVGVAQWLLFRRNLNKTGWWPVMSAVAWPLGYMFGGSLGAVVGQTLNVPFIGGMIGSLLIGAIVGAITGAVLLWTLRENRTLLDGLREEAERAKA
jgi:hypothetical protein